MNDSAGATAVVTLALPGRILPTGLELPEGLSIEKWLVVGAQLQSAGRSLMWWLGDWWLYGEDRYGEAASQAAEVDSDPKTLSNAGWVAKRFEFSRRRENLSWGHHREVAALPPDQQDELLGKLRAPDLHDVLLGCEKLALRATN